jgi:thiamine biosynthesis lipoprotein
VKTREIRRVRPLLGTLVEVSAWGEAGAVRSAIESAFAAIGKVHRLMSVHDPASDVARVNREAHERPVRVHPWTAEVLRLALRLQGESCGSFDCGIGSRLEKAGFLPAGTASAARSASASECNIHIAASNVVRLRRPLCLDLGGIAKGYAVDRAVEALRQPGIAAGSVNAGGDLRVFGLTGFPIMVRDPLLPGRLVHLLTLSEGAVATSAGYHSSRHVKGRHVMPIFDPVRERFLACNVSVTVMTASCVMADALTKVAAIRGAAAAPMLLCHGAHAFWWQGERMYTTWEAACPAAA